MDLFSMLICTEIIVYDYEHMYTQKSLNCLFKNIPMLEILKRIALR